MFARINIFKKLHILFGNSLQLLEPEVHRCSPKKTGVTQFLKVYKEKSYFAR